MFFQERLGLFLAPVFLAGFALLAMTTPKSWAHGDNRVEIEWNSALTLQAGTNELKFELIDEDTEKVLKADDILITHEKKVHFFIYDAGLKEFRHIHPEFDGTDWVVSVDLPKSGKYFACVQGKLASDGAEFSTVDDQLKVVNGTSPNPVPATLGDHRSGDDGEAKVALSTNRIVAKRNVNLDLEFSRLDGTAVQLTPYLGEIAHVFAVMTDGDTTVHTHPMQHGNHYMIHGTFPEAGDYRLWVQFIEHGILRNISLSVTVYPR